MKVGLAKVVNEAATKAVDAAAVELSPAVAVGTTTVPVNVGLAFVANEATTNAVDAAFVELSPAVGVGTVTVPVKVGEADKGILTTDLDASPDPVS